MSFVWSFFLDSKGKTVNQTKLDLEKFWILTKGWLIPNFFTPLKNDGWKSLVFLLNISTLFRGHVGFFVGGVQLTKFPPPAETCLA